MSYNRRYFLHSQVRRKGIELITKAKTINVNPGLSAIAQNNKAIAELRDKYNYSIQFINPMMTL